MTTATNELATFTPYAPPYWEKRAWDPKGRNAWEKRALLALELGSVDSIDKLMAKRLRSPKWSKPYGKRCVFGLDIWDDIQAGERLVRREATPQQTFQDWRAENARWVENLDVEWDEHNRKLHLWEEAIEKRFNWALKTRGW
jgi:hypothetical protein